MVKNSEVIVVVNTVPEFSEILSKVPSEKTIYDLVNIDFEGKADSKNYEGISW